MVYFFSFKRIIRSYVCKRFVKIQIAMIQ